MAAKVAGTWNVLGEIGGQADLTAVGTTKLHTLGKRIRAVDVGSTAYGFGEFIYLQGVGSTVRGSVVLIKDDYSTSLVATRDKGALAVALGACVASNYGWYQIRGTGVAVAGGSITANTPMYISNGGAVDDAVVAGDQIIGMRAVTADDTSTVTVTMGCYPATADFDNS